MDNPRNIVGPVVRQLREEQGLTQSMIVAKLNVARWDISRETYAKIEAQIRWVADFELVWIAAALGVEAGQLLKLAVRRKVDNEPR